VGQCVVHRQEGSVCVAPFLIISLSLFLSLSLSRSLALSLYRVCVGVCVCVSGNVCGTQKRLAQEREGELLM
jgi:hypothetical protein